MIKKIAARWLLLFVCFQLLSPVHAADATPPVAPTQSRDSATNDDRPLDLKPGPDDGRIAFTTAMVLPRLHYSHQPFNDTVSSEFLDEYLDSLDPQHMHFIQADLDEFEQYRTHLDNLTLNPAGADLKPAYVIFKKFVERLRQRVAYADELLKTDKFTFNTDDRITIDRRKLPYPANLAEAKTLWRQRLRYEYLQEKLGLEDAAKKKKTAEDSTTADKTVEPVKTMDEQIVDTLTRRYQRTLHYFTQWDNDDVLGIYLTALTHVYDPHSDYFNKDTLDNFKISMNLQLFGIGAELHSDQDGYCQIQRLLPGGPASKSKKIHEGDRIVAVAQGDEPPVDVVDMNLTKIVQLIRGPKGTEVRLTLMPAGSSAAQPPVSLIRDEISLPDQHAKGKIIDLPNANGSGETVRLGVIDLPSFYAPMNVGDSDDGGAAPQARTSVDVAKLLTKFEHEGVRGVVLDLRRNGGGSLEEAIRLTGLFIKDGPVVQVSSWNGNVQVDEDNDPSELYKGPLIVLTSRFSASASEIVAGALQDYGRAIIVGDTSTHGKGTVQSLNDLRDFMRVDDSDTNELGALKITIRKFYRPSGVSTQLKGVLPDIVLPSKWNYAKDIGEKSLDYAMEGGSIDPVPYDKMNLVQPYLAELLKRSSERVATNEDFNFVRQEIQQFRKQQDEKTVSLNEKERLKEIADAEALQKKWDKERLARKAQTATIYDISLKQAGLLGLPAPENETNSVAKADAGKPSAASGTNSVSLAKSGAVSKPDDDTADDDTAPAVDVDLEEAEHIMVDYLSLLPKGSSLVATQVEHTD